jgi:hypothetical protein
LIRRRSLLPSAADPRHPEASKPFKSTQRGKHLAIDGALRCRRSSPQNYVWDFRILQDARQKARSKSMPGKKLYWIRWKFLHVEDSGEIIMSTLKVSPETANYGVKSTPFGGGILSFLYIFPLYGSGNNGREREI